MIYESTGEVREPRLGEYYIAFSPEEIRISREVLKCRAFPWELEGTLCRFCGLRIMGFGGAVYGDVRIIMRPLKKGESE